ncbi:MAG: tyrosine--tRNA ligase [Bacteroidia bacterium]|nr:tyrosine--tRNA ligase [Bacteroidia bacterium]MDW8332860.1 tyrosine--tRNA ligase [Bacteroidia bacterium]
MWLEELKWRGLYQDSTPGAEEISRMPGMAVYAGFDPTASSLHVGHLTVAMLLTHARRFGLRPIAVVGGATGMVGDPSGKSQERKLLDLDTLRANEAGVKKQLEKLIVGDGPEPLVLNNYDWLAKFSLLDFLREIGKHFTVGYMTAKESVQNRLETGISFTEFTYQLLQAYDFYYLYKNYGCRLQVGGSDQWGNITAGIELIRRLTGGEAHGVTAPLLTRPDGSKFGKSEGENVWLDPERTSPYKFYQFWFNVSDDEVARLLRIFSLRTREQIEEILERHVSAPHLREAQKTLAAELTERVHGRHALETALAASEALFGDAPLAVLERLSPPEFGQIFEGVPSAVFNRSWLEAGRSVVELLAEAGAVASKSEARRLVQSGGLKINKIKISSPDHIPTTADLLAGRYLLIQSGKKKYHIAVFES